MVWIPQQIYCVLTVTTYFHIAEAFLRSSSRSPAQEFPNILWSQNVNCPVHKSLPVVPILSQINPSPYHHKLVISLFYKPMLFRCRLEKMRRAMGSGQREEEVLIQTSTGFFRFQGISEKFTRRLYEWEKARGIGPEASTFALLDPGYRPSSDGSSPSHGKVAPPFRNSVQNIIKLY
jgi:hypothetical protein